ncbi:ParB/RepB/Spo0J family partition protein [uncultured Bradyrhizobium sp.]|uniref:ParB/RepB/Spo0J family partition protein n=1 Tax=uncultured Bradyrhizobium sp. TaxID=199684 RepID=UPI0035CA9EA1
MTKKNRPQAADTAIRLIPLDKLKKSFKNVRKQPHGKADIEALAASIKANGQLQNLVVEPETDPRGKATGFYLVTAGEGRRLAQLLRVKHKEIAKTEPIRCIVDAAHNPVEISLAENAIRSDMHPADQFEAFQALHAGHGMNAEDIAARFGVTPAVVKQRLKLAAIDPALIEAYRDGEMNLDQLTAFAISDDREMQRAVWQQLGGEAEREDILAALTEEHICASDRRAKFIGEKAYIKAGGAVLRDLFEQEGEGYFTDAALLHRLVEEKLEKTAAQIRREGWKWVTVAARLDYGATADMRRIYPQLRALSEEEQAQLETLQAEYAALENQSSEDDSDLSSEFDRLDQAIAELVGEDEYDLTLIARAGAFVSIGHDGKPEVQRGYIRTEDNERPAAKAKLAKGNGPAPLSEALVAELTAHRTVALRNILARHHDIAVIAVVQAIAAQTFYPHADRLSCLDINARSAFLGTHAKGIDDSPAGREIAIRHEAWHKMLPDDPAALWVYVARMESADRLELLAHCVSLTVDAVRKPKTPGNEEAVAPLAQALCLDMAAHWTPTPGNYLGRVSKERILDAVREAVSPEAADNLAKLKKTAMAEAAADRLQGKGWLPDVLRSAA